MKRIRQIMKLLHNKKIKFNPNDKWEIMCALLDFQMNKNMKKQHTAKKIAEQAKFNKQAKHCTDQLDELNKVMRKGYLV